LDANLNEKSPCQISYWFAVPENQNVIGGKPKQRTEKAHDGGVYPELSFGEKGCPEL
jgi:hypothetical protein